MRNRTIFMAFALLLGSGCGGGGGGGGSSGGTGTGPTVAVQGTFAGNSPGWCVRDPALAAPAGDAPAPVSKTVDLEPSFTIDAGQTVDRVLVVGGDPAQPLDLGLLASGPTTGTKLSVEVLYSAWDQDGLGPQSLSRAVEFSVDATPRRLNARTFADRFRVQSDEFFGLRASPGDQYTLRLKATGGPVTIDTQERDGSGRPMSRISFASRQVRETRFAITGSGAAGFHVTEDPQLSSEEAFLVSGLDALEGTLLKAVRGRPRRVGAELVVVSIPPGRNPDNVGVQFDATGGGAPSTQVVPTDASGDAIAFVTWSAVGTFQATATIVAIPSLKVTYTVQVFDLGPPAKLVNANDSGETDFEIARGSTLDLAAAVLDANDLPVPGVTVRFDPSGPGAPAPFTGITDAEGIARAGASWATAGAHGVAVTARDAQGSALALAGSPRTYTVRVSTGQPATLALVEKPQALRPTQAGTFRVAVEDDLGFPVPGASVRFSPTGGAPTVTATTGPDGKAGAAASWPASAAGAQSVVAIVLGAGGTPLAGVAGSPLTMAVQVSSGDPARMEAVGSSGRSVPVTLGSVFQVRVLDALSLGVPGVRVQFAAAGGGAPSPATATTGADGVAQATIAWPSIGTFDLEATSVDAGGVALLIAGNPLHFTVTTRGTRDPDGKSAVAIAAAAQDDVLIGVEAIGSSSLQGVGTGQTTAPLDVTYVIAPGGGATWRYDITLRTRSPVATATAICSLHVEELGAGGSPTGLVVATSTALRVGASAARFRGELAVARGITATAAPPFVGTPGGFRLALSASDSTDAAAPGVELITEGADPALFFCPGPVVYATMPGGRRILVSLPDPRR